MTREDYDAIVDEGRGHPWLRVNSRRRVDCTGEDLAEAATIREEAERYFVRHFPGHTAAVNAGSATGGVFVVCSPLVEAS